MKLNKNYCEQIITKLKEQISNMSLDEIAYLKCGGKMKKLMKKGGKPKIHIKKENRGKFTEYCGGKVTSECIQRGKNSSNPAIRKRATFAANARRWNK